MDNNSILGDGVKLRTDKRELVFTSILPPRYFETISYCGPDFNLFFTAKPSFEDVPLDSFSDEFFDIERMGLELIHTRVKGVQGVYFLYLGPQYVEGEYMLKFKRYSSPNSIQVTQRLEIESYKIYSDQSIEIKFKVYGMGLRDLEKISESDPLWKFLENRALEYLYSGDRIIFGSYRLSKVCSNVLYLSLYS